MRVKRDMTQEQLAAESELERGYTGGIERGDRNPTLISILKLARALECSPAALLDDVILEEEA